jgi:DNA-binding PadR family transcriptional regulator
VRTAVLLVLADEPMHGYQMMQTMAERSGGAWRPSPGAVYPTIAQLEDEGLVSTQEDGGRRLATLTAAGRRYLRERGTRLGDPFAEFAAGEHGPDLRSRVDELQLAARQISASGSPEQAAAATRVLADARRALYLILAGEPGD